MTTPTQKTTVPKHTHNYTARVYAATCTEDGYTKYTCSCGAEYISDKIPASGHIFGEWLITKAPTETETGLAVRECGNCGINDSKTIGKIVANHSHSYTQTITKNATCTTYGVKTFTCSCGDEYTERIGKIAHQYSETVKEATCTEWGYTTYTCSSCGNYDEDDYTSPLSHDYDYENVKATCTTDGYARYICTRCGDIDVVAETKAKGHSYNLVSDTTTCTTNGVKTEKCSRCGDTKTTTTKAYGHEVKTDKKDAYCGNDGYIYEYCTVCEKEITNKTIPAPGSHKYVARVVADVVEEQLEADPSTHLGYPLNYINYTDWLVDQCEVCGAHSMSDRYFRYTDYEAAVIMLGYVNDLRAEIYGTHNYDLVLDDTLLELAKVRSQEIVNDFSHNGVPLNCGENIVMADYLYGHFLAWKNSPGHYANMINKEYTRFAYAIYISNDGADNNVAYGVQLFKR